MYRYGFTEGIDFVVHHRLVGPGGRYLRRKLYLTSTGVARLIGQRYGRLHQRMLELVARRTQDRALWGPAQRRSE